MRSQVRKHQKPNRGQRSDGILALVLPLLLMTCGLCFGLNPVALAEDSPKPADFGYENDKEPPAPPPPPKAEKKAIVQKQQKEQSADEKPIPGFPKKPGTFQPQPLAGTSPYGAQPRQTLQNRPSYPQGPIEGTPYSSNGQDYGYAGGYSGSGPGPGPGSGSGSSLNPYETGFNPSTCRGFSGSAGTACTEFNSSRGVDLAQQPGFLLGHWVMTKNVDLNNGALANAMSFFVAQSSQDFNISLLWDHLSFQSREQYGRSFLYSRLTSSIIEMKFYGHDQWPDVAFRCKVVMVGSGSPGYGPGGLGASPMICEVYRDDGGPRYQLWGYARFVT
ncbi:MAG: hypothetical protein C5B49_07735, partial [Bdellovibrio sp.]